MFDHRNFAVHGLFPGLVTTRSIANLGHFEIEVIIEPQPGGGGGGWVPAAIGSGADKYKIRIRVTRKGKVWEFERVVGSTMARVAARITGIKIAEPTITVNKSTMVENIEPEIKVTIK